MTRDEAIQRLAKIKPALVREYGIHRIGFFGSVARNEATETSDLDIVVDMEPQSVWVVVGMRQQLEELFGVPVDLVRYSSSLRHRLKSKIDAEACYV